MLRANLISWVPDVSSRPNYWLCNIQGWNPIYHPIYLGIRAWGVVDEGVLEQRPEHEEDADARPHVDGLGVGHGGQGVVDAGLETGNR